MKTKHMLSIVFFLFTANFALATQPWPAEPWTSAQIFTHLDPEFQNNMSGASWNPETQTFWVCRNGRPSVFWALKLNNDGNLAIATDSAGVQAKFDLGQGDLEGICQVDFKSNIVYLMLEGEDFINAYDVSTNGKAVLKNQWNIFAHVPTTIGLGSEGITFVPDHWLKKQGFVDAEGNPYASKNGMGGLMFVAHQNGGKIYVFDLNPNDSNVSFVGAYNTSQIESSGLEFDRSTGLLYIWHNIGDNALEVTKLSSFIENKERRLTPVAEFIGPKTGNLEGIALVPAGAKNKLFLILDDDNQDDAAVMLFKEFNPPMDMNYE